MNADKLLGDAGRGAAGASDFLLGGRWFARWPQAREPECTRTESEERTGHLTVQGFQGRGGGEEGGRRGAGSVWKRGWRVPGGEGGGGGAVRRWVQVDGGGREEGKKQKTTPYNL